MIKCLANIVTHCITKFQNQIQLPRIQVQQSSGFLNGQKGGKFHLKLPLGLLTERLSLGSHLETLKCTRCCGAAIQNLSAFTEFYFQPLARKQPSFIKDTTNMLNKIQKLNEQCLFPEGTLLVSWDIVSMFPNINNELGLGGQQNTRYQRTFATIHRLYSGSCRGLPKKQSLSFQ